jgi:DNA-directed RNA polymerase specialized sigma subunit
MRTITSLSKAIEDLSEEERLVFHSIFSVESETTHTSIPEALKARVCQRL